MLASERNRSINTSRRPFGFIFIFLFLFLFIALLLASCGRKTKTPQITNTPPLKFTPAVTSSPKIPSGGATETPYPGPGISTPSTEVPGTESPGYPYPPSGGEAQATQTQSAENTVTPASQATSGNTAYPAPGATLTPPPGSTTPTENNPYPAPGATQTHQPSQTIASGGTSYPPPQGTVQVTQTRVASSTAPRTPGGTLSPSPRASSPRITGTPPTEAPPSTAQPAPRTIAQTIRIWHSWGAGQVGVLDYLLKTFQGFYPDVAFDVSYVPQEALRDRYAAAVYQGSGPSLMFGPAEWGPSLFRDGFVADLSKAVGVAYQAQISPAALEGARYRGALLGLPYRIRGGVLLYRNRKIIPDPAASFDDLVRQARAATVGGNVGAFLERSLLYSGGNLIGLGGRLMDEDGLPAFNSPQGLAWINLLKQYDQAGATGFNTNRDISLFKQNKIGWIIALSDNQAELAGAIGPENLAIDPWPVAGSGRLAGFVQSDLMYLNPDLSADETYAAQVFMSFMMSPNIQAILVRAGYIPALRDVKVDDPLLSQVMAAFATGVAYPTYPAMDVYWDPLEAAMISIFDNGADPAEALKQADTDIRARLQGTITPTP